MEFSLEERRHYDEIRCQAVTSIDEALYSGSDISRSFAYANILQRINSLRLICNLGVHYQNRHEEPSRAFEEDWKSVAQATFNAQREMEPVACLYCSSLTGLSESLLETPDTKQAGQFFRCLKFCCGECAHKVRRSHSEAGCGHSPPCPVATVSLEGQAAEEVVAVRSLGSRVGLDLPSKIQALVTDIQCLPSHTKWY